MVDLQILNRVMAENSLRIIKDNGLTKDHFVQYADEYDFITDHFKEYGRVPDKETMLKKFPDFQFFEVGEPDEYLVKTIREEDLYAKTVPIIKKAAELLKTDSRESVEYLRSSLQKLGSVLNTAGYDIVKNSDDRLKEVMARKDKKFFVPTGFDELDRLIMGWKQGEELVTWLGRTNEGKSWIVEKCLQGCWAQGYPVGLYSGEMSRTSVGFRFDSLHTNFSNSLLTAGRVDEKKYANYLETLRLNPTAFKVITPKDLGGPATVSQLRDFVERNGLKVLGVDQYSLMRDERARKGQQTRMDYAHISEDLFLLSERLKIPVIACAQANRAAMNKRNDDEELQAPKIEHLAESDAVAQNSSKIISIKNADNVLEMNILKNRDGQKGLKLMYHWDIDTGVFQYIPGENDEDSIKRARANFKDKADRF